MKHLKGINESFLQKSIKESIEYNDDLLDKESSINRVNMRNVFDKLKQDWNMDDEILMRVLLAHGGSYDTSTEYLADMEGFGYETPEDAWEDWCDHYNISHEIENNPFILNYPSTKVNESKVVRDKFKMSDTHRKSIIRKAKSLIKAQEKNYDESSESNKIKIQNKYIKIACKDMGYDFSNFYSTDSKTLDKLLDF